MIRNTDSGTQLMCQLCRNTVPTEMDFVAHMKVHPSCRICGVFMANHIDLKGHVQRDHGQTNMHTCKVCEKVFLTKSGMVEHQRLKHEKSGPRFECMICGLVCVRKKHLEDHIENVHNKKYKQDQSLGASFS